MRVLAIAFCLVSFFASSVWASEGVKAGVLINIIDSHDVQKLKDTLEFGIEKGQEKRVFDRAVLYLDTAMVNVLLDHIGINVCKQNSITVALKDSLSRNFFDWNQIQVKSERKKGAEKGKKNKPKAETSLQGNGFKMIDFLIAKGCRGDNEDPISVAIKNEHFGLVKYLHEKGFPISKSTIFDLVDRGYSSYKPKYPLWYGDIDYVISTGKADINYQDFSYLGFGSTALHKAVYKNELEIVKLLVANGAKSQKAGSTPENSKTPLEAAISSGYIEIAKVLKNVP